MRSMQWQLGMLGTISKFAYRHRETEKNLCRGGRSQDLPNTDFQPEVRHLKLKKTSNANIKKPEIPTQGIAGREQVVSPLYLNLIVAFCFALKTDVTQTSETLYLCIKLQDDTQTDHDLKGITSQFMYLHTPYCTLLTKKTEMGWACGAYG